MKEDSFLVIGSNSFSGSHFVREALSYGFDVCGVSRSEIPNQVFFPNSWESKKEEPKKGKFLFF